MNTTATKETPPGGQNGCQKRLKKMDSTPDLFLTCQADVDGCLTHSSQLLCLDHSTVALSSLGVCQGWWPSVTFRPVSYPDSSRRPRSGETDAVVGGRVGGKRLLLLDEGPADVSRQDVGSGSSTRDACQRHSGWRGRTVMVLLSEGGDRI